MRRVATSLRNERPESDEGTVVVLLDERPWGFHAIDGLPDLEAAAPYRQSHRDPHGRLRLSDGSVAEGFDEMITEELARIRQRARDVGAGRDGRWTNGGRRGLSPYEREVCDAMTARRDAALRLQQVLVDDVAGYECGIEGVRAGLVLELMVPQVGGAARRTVSEAVSEFEASRHRFRLALVAVALDNGMVAAEIGTAFAFSRQLASRYLKEARDTWPELADGHPERSVVVTADG